MDVPAVIQVRDFRVSMGWGWYCNKYEGLGFNFPDELNMGYKTKEPRKDISGVLVQMHTWGLQSKLGS